MSRIVHRMRMGIMLLGMFALLSAFTSKAYPADVVSLRQTRPDKACGPRCLYALMQITGQGRTECGVRCIYELIGKEPFSPTTLGDVKEAAQKLGFSARGRMLSVSALAKMNAYAILPVGISPGTAEKPLHFILVKRIVNGYVAFVDTNTLRTRAFPLSELRACWNGYALVIGPGKGMKALRNALDDLSELPPAIEPDDLEKPDAEQLKDFGIIDAGSSVEHTFTISNAPNHEYKAKIVKKSCSCIAAELGKDVEGRNTVTVRMHLRQAGWQESEVVVLLEPGKSIRRCRLRAYGKDSFRIYPRKAHIEAPQGGLVEYPVRIEYFTGCRDVVKFDHMATSLPQLTCGPVISCSSTKGEVTTVTFDVPLQFDGGTPLGQERLSGSADFVFDTGAGARRISLDLVAIVGAEEARLTPREALLIVSKSSRLPTPCRVRVDYLIAPGPVRIAIQGVGSLPLHVETTATPGSSFMIEISVVQEELSDVSLGMNKGTLLIMPEGGHSAASLTLPVNLFVYE